MGDVLNTLARLHDGVTRVGFHLSKLCLGIIVFAYCYEVFARYFFAAPTWWSSEAVQYSLCIGCLPDDALKSPGKRAMSRSP